MPKTAKPPAKKNPSCCSERCASKCGLLEEAIELGCSPDESARVDADTESVRRVLPETRSA